MAGVPTKDGTRRVFPIREDGHGRVRPRHCDPPLMTSPSSSQYLQVSILLAAARRVTNKKHPAESAAARVGAGRRIDGEAAKLPLLSQAFNAPVLTLH